MTLKEWFGYGLERVEIKKEIIQQNIPEKNTTEYSNELPLGLRTDGIQFTGNNNKQIVESELIFAYIQEWRTMVMFPECGEAVDEIGNEGIYSDAPIKISLDTIPEKSEKIKKAIEDEFENILSLLQFKYRGAEIFREWYIDGRLFYEVVMDKTNLKKGIVKLNKLDPLNVQRVTNTKTKEMLYHYKDPTNQNPVKQIPIDLMVYVGSGYFDRTQNLELSWLHRARKPYNNLRNIEDAVVISRLIKSTEKRVFNVDTGYLTAARANQYVNEVIGKFKNGVIYDTVTGKTNTQKNLMSMVEDFFIPKSADGRGTTIDTLPAGASLDTMEDVYYFLSKLYHALFIPESRIDNKNNKSTISFNNQQEVERDEIKFFKFIEKLRMQFNMLFIDLLKRQLVSKNIMKQNEFEEIMNFIEFNYVNDNMYKEIKENETLRGRLDLLQQVDSFMGKYFDLEWAAINILRLTEDEWKKRQKKMEETRAQIMQNTQEMTPPESFDDTPEQGSNTETEKNSKDESEK